MTLEKIIKEVEDEHDNIAYVYIKDGKEFFTPNLRVALKRNESNINKRTMGKYDLIWRENYRNKNLGYKV